MIGQPNHAIAPNDFLGGRVWLEDDAGAATVQLATKPVTFNARRYHMVEPHQGNMWALAAKTPQSFKTSDVADALKRLDFPVMLILHATYATGHSKASSPETPICP